MKIQEIITREGNFKEKIMPLLIDEVFHITSDKNYKKILETGYIKNSLSLRNNFTTDHSKNSYFYKRGYISLFDGRKKKWNKWGMLYEELWKYIPHAHKRNYIILIFKKNLYLNIKETNHKIAIKKHEMIIPFIEVGYKNKISIDDISKIIRVSKKQDKYKEGSLGWLASNAEKYLKKHPTSNPRK